MCFKKFVFLPVLCAIVSANAGNTTWTLSDVKAGSSGVTVDGFFGFNGAAITGYEFDVGGFLDIRPISYMPSDNTRLEYSSPLSGNSPGTLVTLYYYNRPVLSFSKLDWNLSSAGVIQDFGGSLTTGGLNVGAWTSGSISGIADAPPIDPPPPIAAPALNWGFVNTNFTDGAAADGYFKFEMLSGAPSIVDFDISTTSSRYFPGFHYTMENAQISFLTVTPGLSELWIESKGEGLDGYQRYLSVYSYDWDMSVSGQTSGVGGSEEISNPFVYGYRDWAQDGGHLVGNISSVPEPASIALALGGLILIGMRSRRALAASAVRHAGPG